MDSERWRRIDALIQEAVDLGPEERDSFLDRECAGDDDLRAHVERLLSFDDPDDELFDRPAAEHAAAIPVPSEHELQPGQQLGHYRILERIGAGGMGEVYLALDTTLERKVALKLLPTEFTTDEGRVRRFRTEARAASALNHPNILTIYEIGRNEAQHFIATEYIEGETLRQRIRHGPIGLRETLELVTQTAAALATAHQVGIVHRDVKPENIMVRPDGYVKVVDFGLAKLSEVVPLPADSQHLPSRGTDTAPGLVMGTVRYMSPEQARGLALNSRSDQFSLGIVMYEMLAGRRPFEGETNADLITAILSTEPPPLREIAPDVPEDLERIVARTLAKDVDDRYATTDDLLAELRRLTRDHEVRAEITRLAGDSGGAIIFSSGGALAGESAGTLASTLVPAEPSRWLSKATVRKAALPIVVALLVAGGAGAAAVAYLNREPVERFANVRMDRLEESEKTTVATISPNGQFVAEAVSEARGRSLWVRQLATGSRIQVVAPSDFVYFAPAFSPDSEYVYYTRFELKADPGADSMGVVFRVPVLGGASAKIIENTYGPIAVAPDGSQIAFIRADAATGGTELVVAGSDGSGARTLATRAKPVAFLSGGVSWSPDGQRIACSDTSGLLEVSVEDGSEQPFGPSDLGGAEQVVWMPGGDGLILVKAAEGQSNLQLWHLSYPEGVVRRLTNDLANYATVSVTADGRTMLTVQGNLQSNLWVAPQGDARQARQITDGRYDLFRDVAWTPDGRIVAPSRSSGLYDVYVMNADGTDRRQLSSEMRAPRIAVSRDGRFVAAMSYRNGAPAIWRLDVGGGDPAFLADGSMPTCSPDGWVIYTGADQRLWKIPIAGGAAVPVTDRPATFPRVSPDGKLIACLSASEDGAPPRVTIIAADTGRVVRTLESQASITLRWMPDGSALTFVQSSEGVGNIWRLPLAGGEPTQLTAFEAHDIFGYDWAADGTLVCSRAVPTHDSILITDAEAP